MSNMQTMNNRTYRSSARYDSTASRRSERLQSMSSAAGRNVYTSRSQSAASSERNVYTSRSQNAASSARDVRTSRPQSAASSERNVRTSRPQSAASSGRNARTGRPQSASSYDRSSRRRDWEYEEYIDGNTVRKAQLETLLEEDPKKQLHQRARKNREKAVHMNFGYVAFLVAALVLMGMVLISYINLRSELTSSIKRISRMESELYSLQQENDEYETRINSSVNLEDIRRIAIEELGMKYATEGQIVNIEGSSDDYVRKYAEIP